MSNRGKWILIVDDDIDFTESIKQELSVRGFNPIVSNISTDAMAKLNNQKFLCILMDLKLKDRSGSTIIDQLRSSYNSSNLNFQTPVIVISGALSTESIRGLSQKVQAIMAKPFKIETLIEKMQLLIENAGIKAAAKSLHTSDTVKSSPQGNELAEFVHDISTLAGTMNLAIGQLKEKIQTKPELATEQKMVELLDRSISKLVDLITKARNNHSTEGQ